MKVKHIVKLALALVMAVSLVTPVWAQKSATPEETRNLFETAGPKQTNKDFKPAPDRINTSFGTLNFEHGLLFYMLAYFGYALFFYGVAELVVVFTNIHKKIGSST